MKRVQVNSKYTTPNINLTYPTLDANKMYTITIEKLRVPARDSLILNKPLFTVERRLIEDIDLFGGDEILPVHADYTTFTPQNVRTVTQFVYQANRFFRELCQRLVTKVIPDLDLHQYAVVDMNFFPRQDVDWYTVDTVAVKQAIQCVFRPDGKVGFRFTVDGVKLFVIKLTDAGKRIFGSDNRYIAVDSNGQFKLPYDEYRAGNPPDPDGFYADQNLPDPITDGYIYYSTTSLFSHINYRHELVLQASLPLDNSVEIDDDRSYYRRQLACYRFPSPDTSMTARGVVDRSINEKYQSVYVFEQSLRTHNKFVLKGTELQNFNLYLISRRHEYKDGKYVTTESPYEMESATFYTVQFALFPIK